MPDIKTKDGFRAHISQNRYSIWQQPVICAKSGTILHYEWLVRFDDDTGLERIIRPAEISGAIYELDLSMLRQAVNNLNQNPKRTAIAVNLSGASLLEDVFERNLLQILSGLKAPAEKLIFELTETWDLRDLGPAKRILAILQDRGHNLCLDDVGAGAASIRYLRAFPTNWLKIDGEFLLGASQNARERAVLKAILSLREALDVRFIAEGIETEQLAKFAKKSALVAFLSAAHLRLYSNSFL